MKKHTIVLLAAVTAVLVSFTLGLFLGRNYFGAPISLSFPEEMTQMPTQAAPDVAVSADTNMAPLNINTASYEELMTLPGVGEGLALEIVSYRASSGGFSHVEELLNVPGIGEKRLEAMLHLITVGGNP